MPKAIIAGAGLAGLSAAIHLHREGWDVTVYEADNRPGGRVQTDELDGFLLDRGFQVLLTAYPECQAMLDYDALQLRPFRPGALIRKGGRFAEFSDPWRRPFKLVSTALAPVGSLRDKLRIGKLRSASRRKTLEEIFSEPESTTLAALQEFGFSNDMIDGFFRPFLGGVFLDQSLQTSSRMLHFVFRMFSLGDTAIPRQGMGQIPWQLATQLPDDAVKYNCPVTEVGEQHVRVTGGESDSADAIILATDAKATANLLDRPQPEQTEFCGTVCLYFAAENAPVDQPLLVLNGEGVHTGAAGLVNNFCVPSLVSPSYAPPGKHLCSVSIVGNPDSDDDALDHQVRQELGAWFGSEVERWQTLRIDRIPHALPRRNPPTSSATELPPRGETATSEAIFICGDHQSFGSIHHAMVNGREVAEAVLKHSAVTT